MSSPPPAPPAPGKPEASGTPPAPAAAPAPTAAAAPAAPSAPKDEATEKNRLSGKHWKKTADDKWPGSTSIESLSDDFQPKVEAFLKMLADNSISTQISATDRPAERAYLFHYCLEVASGRKKPSEVEKLVNVDINWDHGDDAKSKVAAQEMAEEFGLVGVAAYPSNHTGGNAIDMKMDFSKNKDKEGTYKLAYKHAAKNVVRLIQVADEATVGTSAQGKSIADIADRDLSKAGGDFGLKRSIKSDIVHWSLTGG